MIQLSKQIIRVLNIDSEIIFYFIYFESVNVKMYKYHIQKMCHVFHIGNHIYC